MVGQTDQTQFINILFSYSIMEDTLTSLTSLELVVKIKRSTYNKERYEANKDYILKYRNFDNF